jgi:hypothetical protein
MGRPHPWDRPGKKRIEEIDGIGCEPVQISATTEEVLEWISEGLRSEMLTFPDSNSPIRWPRYSIDALCGQERDVTAKAGQVASG